MLLDTTPLTSDGEDAVSFQRDTRDMSADEGTPPPERLTNFFIADILSPDFGRKRCAKCAVRPDGDSPSGDTWGDRTPWTVPACRGKTELEKAASSGTKHARREEPEWPAWVYCTRYSDRPTAGELPDMTTWFTIRTITHPVASLYASCLCVNANVCRYSGYCTYACACGCALCMRMRICLCHVCT